MSDKENEAVKTLLGNPKAALMGLTFFMAPLITRIYTRTKEAGRLSNDFILFFRIIVTINADISHRNDAYC